MEGRLASHWVDRELAEGRKAITLVGGPLEQLVSPARCCSWPVDQESMAQGGQEVLTSSLLSPHSVFIGEHS